MLVSILALLPASIVVCVGADLPDQEWLAPLKGGDSSTRIPDEYIVYFKPDYTLEQHFETIGKDLSTSRGFVDMDFLPGYIAPIDDETLNEKVRRDPGVRLVENDHKAELISPVSSSGPYYSNDSLANQAKRDYTQETTRDAPYGIQIVAAGSKLSTPVRDGGKYDFVKDGGKGVQVYILDTGIRTSHKMFQGVMSISRLSLGI